MPGGCLLRGGVCRGGGVCVQGVSAPLHAGIHPLRLVNRMTDVCENITFPQLLLRTVIKTNDHSPV